MSTCYYPLRITRDSENNIVFTNDGTPSLPCGQCLGCRLNHAEGWAIRMVHEASLHDENSFLTLTYDEEHLPDKNNLSYRALTLFIKRLRKALASTPYNKKFKYYAVGEYGENFSRPHYHIILFGFDFTYGIRYKGVENRHEHEYTKNGNKYYRSTFLDQLWGQGKCDIGEVNYNTCMYVAKYVTKKVNGRNKDSHYTRVDNQGEIFQVEPEKARMSKGGYNPKTKEKTSYPIGHDWLAKFHSDVYPSNHVIHEAKRYKVPKYYDKWLEKNHPDLFLQIKEERENFTSSRTQQDLTRIHEVKLLNQKNNPRDLDGTAPTNEIDKEILAYSKREQTTLHERRKSHAKAIHGL